jgi:hypothetical protein
VQEKGRICFGSSNLRRRQSFVSPKEKSLFKNKDITIEELDESIKPKDSSVILKIERT